MGLVVGSGGVRGRRRGQGGRPSGPLSGPARASLLLLAVEDDGDDGEDDDAHEDACDDADDPEGEPRHVLLFHLQS